MNKINKNLNIQKKCIGIKITNKAAEHICALMKNDPKMLGLWISVKQFGCSGLGYIIKKAYVIEKNDYIFENNEAKIYVPITAMSFIDGTELDYVKEGLNQVFKFKNPKAQHTCGCGSSFGL